MVEVKLLSGTHSRLEDGSRVRYQAGDVLEIGLDEYKTFENKFEVLVKESDSNEPQEAFNPKIYITYYGGGYYDVEGYETRIRGEQSAIDKAIELHKRGDL